MHIESLDGLSIRGPGRCRAPDVAAIAIELTNVDGNHQWRLLSSHTSATSS
jgi:hypothetical protein